MKKHIISGVLLLIAAVMSLPALTVSASGSALYLQTSAVPDKAAEYAKEIFSGLSESDFLYMGFASDEAENAVLGSGFCAKPAKSDVDTSDIFYFPVLCNDKISALMAVTYNGRSYGYQLGNDDISEAMNDIDTSFDDPLEIYVSENAFYGVTDDGVKILSYGIIYSGSEIEKEIDSIKKLHKAKDSETDVIAVYGNIENGFVRSDDKIYCIDPDGNYAKGWQTIDGKKYYFKKDGSAVTGSAVIGGVRYKFSSDGVCGGKYSGWAKKDGKYYYYKDGVMKTNCWLTVKGKKTYYLTEDGSRASGKITIKGKTYNFSDNGKLL